MDEKTNYIAAVNRDHRSIAHGWQRKGFAEAVQGQRWRLMPVLLVARDDSSGIGAKLVRSRSSRNTRQRQWLLVVLDLGRSHLLSSRSPRVTVVSAFSDLHQNFQGSCAASGSTQGSPCFFFWERGWVLLRKGVSAREVWRVVWCGVVGSVGAGNRRGGERKPDGGERESVVERWRTEERECVWWRREKIK